MGLRYLYGEPQRATAERCITTSCTSRKIENLLYFVVLVGSLWWIVGVCKSWETIEAKWGGAQSNGDFNSTLYMCPKRKK